MRGNPHLTSALSGVTAAVVGVVLNLALVFGAAVIWPHGLAGGTRWVAVLMSAAAFALLYRYKVDVLWVVLGGGAIGLVGAGSRGRLINRPWPSARDQDRQRPSWRANLPVSRRAP